MEVLPFSDHNFRNVFTDERHDLAEIVEPWLQRLDLVGTGGQRPRS